MLWVQKERKEKEERDRCNVLQAWSWKKASSLISHQLTLHAAIELHLFLVSVCAYMYMWAYACVQEQGEGNISSICRTGKTVWNLSKLCTTDLESLTFGGTTGREMISEGFVIIPLVTGANILLSFPWTRFTPLPSAGRWNTRYSADYHRDPCGEDIAENHFLAFILYLLPPARLLFPSNKTHFVLACKLSTRFLEARKPNTQLLLSPSLVFKGTETVFIS